MDILLTLREQYANAWWHAFEFLAWHSTIDGTIQETHRTEYERLEKIAAKYKHQIEALNRKEGEEMEKNAAASSATAPEELSKAIKKVNDPVSSPSHYQGKYECIDEMIELFGIDAVIGFCKCNVYKYRFRSNKKNGEEDLQKANEYMGFLMNLRKGLGIHGDKKS